MRISSRPALIYAGPTVLLFLLLFAHVTALRSIALVITVAAAAYAWRKNPGPPIPTDDLSHLFEPFYRASATSDSTPGWGLGLTFVKRAVEEHHGTIEASSDQDAIRVRVVLPAAATHNIVGLGGNRDPVGGSH